MPPAIRGLWLGRRDYSSVYRLQCELHALRRDERIGDTVVLVEHDPVITLGRGGRLQHLLASTARLQELGIELVHTDRGGDITLHAPGQLVCYPILKLPPERRDVRRYVHDITESMRRLAALFSVDAGTVTGLVGLWVDQASPGAWPGERHAHRLAKLGALGVRLSRWVSMHGFAFNLTTDLAYYSLIVPCGIRKHPVTSIHQLTSQTPTVRAAAELAYACLAQVFDADAERLQDASSNELAQLSSQLGR